jgi:hypothetical protein
LFGRHEENIKAIALSAGGDSGPKVMASHTAIPL